MILKQHLNDKKKSKYKNKAKKNFKKINENINEFEVTSSINEDTENSQSFNNEFLSTDNSSNSNSISPTKIKTIDHHNIDTYYQDSNLVDENIFTNNFEEFIPNLQSSHTINSVLSVNTDYSNITKNILIKHTKHSYNRAVERKLSDDLIKKCCKYGKKEEQPDGRVRYKLGHLIVVKTGSKQTCEIVTTFEK